LGARVRMCAGLTIPGQEYAVKPGYVKRARDGGSEEISGSAGPLAVNGVNELVFLLGEGALCAAECPERSQDIGGVLWQ